MYRTLGDMVWVSFHLEGTSNSTDLTFTLPYASYNVGSSFNYMNALGFTYDNSVYLPVGYMQLGSNDNVVKCMTSGSSAGVDKGWTASGSKIVTASFWYMKA
jgi:hypothetical protein